MINREDYLDDYGTQVDPLFDMVDDLEEQIKQLRGQLDSGGITRSIVYDQLQEIVRLKGYINKAHNTLESMADLLIELDKHTHPNIECDAAADSCRRVIREYAQ